MAVLIEALSVVVRRETIGQRYEGGWPGFVADAVNNTLCADSEIARVGFMHPNNVGTFIQRLNVHGLVFLDAAKAAIDIVVIDQRKGPTTSCAWIEFFRHEVPGGTVSAARLAGSQEKGLFCPDGWSFEHSLSREFQFYPGTDPTAHLKFLRHEHETDVFRDPKTGQEVYLARPNLGGDETDSDADDVASGREFEALWAEATKLLEPYLVPNISLQSSKEIADVARSRDLMERITALDGVTWRPWWLLGLARRLLRDREGAYAAFVHAYDLAPDELEVGRNLAMECIALGYGREAVAVTAAVVRLAPDDSGVIANHALALLVAGELDGSLREIQRAEHLDPDDDVTRNLRKLIDDVCDGKIEAPSRIET